MSFDTAHTSFVLAAYGLSFAVMAGLVIWHIARSRRVTQRLSELEATGAPRRKAATR